MLSGIRPPNYTKGDHVVKKCLNEKGRKYQNFPPMNTNWENGIEEEKSLQYLDFRVKILTAAITGRSQAAKLVDPDNVFVISAFAVTSSINSMSSINSLTSSLPLLNGNNNTYFTRVFRDLIKLAFEAS